VASSTKDLPDLQNCQAQLFLLPLETAEDWWYIQPPKTPISPVASSTAAPVSGRAGKGKKKRKNKNQPEASKSTTVDMQGVDPRETVIVTQIFIIVVQYLNLENNNASHFYLNF